MNRMTLITMSAMALGLAFLQPAVAAGEAPGTPASKAVPAKVPGDIQAAEKGWQMIADGAVLIDVRSAQEFNGGHIEGALNIPHTELDAITKAIGANTDAPVVLYCRSGRRADQVKDALESQGYTQVFNATGFEALQATRP
jgi:phage shock protein E